MNALTALMLLALGADPTSASHYPGASQVFRCTFDSSGDDNISGWPPGWTRRHGPGFPRYVHVRVAPNRPPTGGCSLRVELEGGGAAAYGPAIAVQANLRYVLEGYIETSGLKHDAAYLSLIFLDAKRNKIGTFTSEKLSGANPWKKVCLGPLLPPAGAASLLLGVQVEPQGEMQDLHGTVSFGGLWLGQLPNVVLTAQPVHEEITDQEKANRNSMEAKLLPASNASATVFRIFSPSQPIEVVCAVSGFQGPNYEIHFRLRDVDGHTIAEHRQAFNQPPPTATPEKQVSLPNAQANWRLPDHAAGFYRVRASVETALDKNAGDSAAYPCDLTFAVIDPQELPVGSEFGWSLGPQDPDVGLVSLASLLVQGGIHWVKYPFAVKDTVGPAVEPVSQGKTDKPTEIKPADIKAAKIKAAKEAAERSMESLITFCDHLETAGVGLVGSLQPPSLPADPAGRRFEMLAAEAFARDPKIWYPSIEPILARLATEIRCWQIGDDHDPGWASCRELSGVVARTKTQLDQVGQDLDVGIPWSFSGPLPLAASKSAEPLRLPLSNGAVRSLNPRNTVSSPTKAPWRFLSLPCDASLGDDRLGRALDDTKSAGVARWISLESLPREGHPPSERVSHLVDRILTAKMHGAEGIFFAHPFDAERGLFDRDGSPSELFVPWRTTALQLGGKVYVGDLDLPHGTQVHCFRGNGKYVGLIPGGTAGHDSVYLGTELRAHDLWGKIKACPPTLSATDGTCGRAALAASAPQSEVAVQTTPIFLTELDGPLTQWQLDVAFSPDRLPSVPSAVTPVTLELRNSFPSRISGQVVLRGPENWQMEPRNIEFRIEPGAPWKQRLDVILPNDVVGGRQLVRLDFEIHANRLYRFTMYRPLTVTLGDVMFEGHAALNDRGMMEIRQTLINTGKRAAAFRCDLLAPDRQRQSSDVNIQPAARSDLTYELRDGEQLLGKVLWLRAEEVDGPHVLNFRMEVPATGVLSAAPNSRPM